MTNPSPAEVEARMQEAEALLKDHAYGPHCMQVFEDEDRQVNLFHAKRVLATRLAELHAEIAKEKRRADLLDEWMIQVSLAIRGNHKAISTKYGGNTPERICGDCDDLFEQHAERDRLRAWKAEAMTVLADNAKAQEETGALLGETPARQLRRLRAEIARKDEAIQQARIAEGEAMLMVEQQDRVLKRMRGEATS